MGGSNQRNSNPYGSPSLLTNFLSNSVRTVEGGLYLNGLVSKVAA